MLTGLIAVFYKHFLKRIFFLFDPEFVHNRISLFGNILGSYPPARFLVGKLFRYENKMLEQKLAGLVFKNPVGLSAGFDKNARLLKILAPVGFGFAEIGSVTFEPYAGNPKPRLFRLPKSKGLVVYYGLMNEGVSKIARRIKKTFRKDFVLGISIAKTNCQRTAAQEAGIEDYFECARYLEKEQIGDYYTLNISCPNTFGGEPFTTRESLDALLNRIAKLKIKKAVFVKMPINLKLVEFDELLQVIIKHKIDGVIIGNLTKVRDPKLIKDFIPDNVKGGISGLPTQKLSNELISYTHRKYGKKLVIIGVGGIFNARDAYEKFRRGASLVQLITGMIYEGPQLIGKINKELVQMLERDGYKNIAEAIGVANG